MVWSTEKCLAGRKIASQGKLLVLELMLVVVVVVFISSANGAPKAADLISHGCRTKCGDFKIAYPFGADKEECYFDDAFLIDCIDDSIPYLRNASTNIQVSSVSVDRGEGELHILKYTAHGCYNPSNNSFGDNPNDSTWADLSLTKFSISTKNKFTVIGCDNYAYIQSEGTIDGTGCSSQCSSPDVVENGTCSGFGCCQVSIPKGLSDIYTEIRSFNNHTNISQFNPCGYAFLVEPGNFTFSKTYLRDFNQTYMPVILDWAIENKPCQEARKNRSSYACGENTDCIGAENAWGYLCNCSSGYRGNPYLSDGCQDINECDSSEHNDCIHQDKCKNMPGTYTCSCPKGHRGDGRKNGERCSVDQLPVIQIMIGLSAGLLVLFLGSSWTYWMFRKRKLMKLKEKFFQQNGGIMLQQQLSKHEKSVKTARIFTTEELKKATDNYNDSRIIGQGGFGTVYRGVLQDNTVVAIKKSKISDKSQIEQFINELVVLAQINHRNVVKLLGCCLETEVPLLVYEFITNGTLSDHLHNESRAPLLTWELRLNIAVETAGALAYLHSATSMPIIHRDIKSTNIILDDNYTAKVSDFGASKLVPLDHTQLTTLVQGTFGYLDPEYFHSSQLTEKSDVYSFGVILAELLTSQKALCFERPEKDRNLAMYFVSALKEDRLFQILGRGLVVESGKFEQIREVAKLAKRCLRVRAEDRPTMKEAANELDSLRMMKKHPWEEVDLYPEETEQFLHQSLPSDGFFVDVPSSSSAAYNSLKDQMIVPLDDGR